MKVAAESPLRKALVDEAKLREAERGLLDEKLVDIAKRRAALAAEHCSAQKRRTEIAREIAQLGKTWSTLCPGEDPPFSAPKKERKTRVSAGVREQEVLEALKAGPMSRGEIAEEIGAGKPVVSSVLGNLAKKGQVEQAGRDKWRLAAPKTAMPTPVAGPRSVLSGRRHERCDLEREPRGFKCKKCGRLFNDVLDALAMNCGPSK